MKSDADTRKRVDRLTTRRDKLWWIATSAAAPGKDQVSLAVAALSKVYADGGRGLTHIDVRASFITRRVEPEGEMSDRRPPDDWDPPMIAVTSPRGIAYQLELLALFVAQAQKDRHKDRQVTLKLALDTTNARDTDWIDLVVAHAGSTQDAVQAASRRDNRLRQVKGALDTLVRNSLVHLPNAGSARGKYEGLQLFDEGGPRPTGAPLRYRVPEPGDKDVIPVPVDFFLKGWIYVLTPSEIALWLMLRHRHEMLATPSQPAPVISITGDVRLRRYGVKKDAYKAWWLLHAAGLIDVDVDPARRFDGTVEEFDHADPPAPHRFILTDAGLNKPAPASVMHALDDALAGNVGLARVASSPRPAWAAVP
jgi:hypothetical protein